jgi:hypothetical protein
LISSPMQISTSVGVVQDILISLSFQKNAKLIVDPSKSQDQPAGICVNALRRNWRVAHHCGVPERVRPMCLSARLLIDKSALIRRLLDAPSEGAHQPAFQGSHQATRPCLPRYSARLTGDTREIVLILGLNQQPARSGPSGCSLRRCSSSRVPPPGCQFIRPRRVVSRHWSLRAA